MNIKIPQNNFNIANTSNVRWKSIPRFNPNHITRNIVEQFKFKNELLGDMFVEGSHTGQFTNYFETVIKNRFGKTFGRELFSIAPENGDMIGYDIKINPEYRQKNHRFGEILRLFSVMEILANNSSGIKIVSKDTAIYFHSKYKFIPDFNEFSKRDSILHDIISDKSPEFSPLSDEAQDMLSKINSAGDNLELQRELTSKTNDLARRYIEFALEKPDPQKNHPLNSCIDMILTRENVIKNKEFFNSLFEKHGIDFRIS